MKKIIPFSKEIEFKTMISKITSISLEHTLRLSDLNTISGDFIVEGTYKMTQASQIDEDFSYKIPIDIAIDDKYETINVSIDIDDFTYEIINEEKIVLNISLCIDNLEEKPIIKDEIINVDSVFEEFDKVREENISGDDEIETLDNLFLDTSTMEKLEIPHEEKEEIIHPSKEFVEVKEEKHITNSNMGSLFSAFKDATETFSTYSVYIVKEEDTIDTILNKYNILKEDLEEYNVLSEIKTGSKVIIPNSKNE